MDEWRQDIESLADQVKSCYAAYEMSPENGALRKFEEAVMAYRDYIADTDFPVGALARVRPYDHVVDFFVWLSKDNIELSR